MSKSNLISLTSFSRDIILNTGDNMKIRTLDDVMTPVKPSTKDEWENIRKELKNNILFASSVELLKNDAPLEARIFPAAVCDGVVIEKVIFQALPGFYVTGNLYRPEDTTKKYPCVLNPHGHWDKGRLDMNPLAMIPTRCMNFAKRGIVAFIYDMTGYNDSKQLEHDHFHEEYESYNYGAFSVQLLSSIKAVDFVSELPYVDADRIGCTGCSGGGTQTYFLTAVDDRIKAAAPINMASCYMQGGCRCENTAFLRTEYNNTDYTMLTSPRPLFMAGCDGDWTAHSEEVEFPAIKNIYKLYGKEENFETFYRSAPHCYEKPTRERAYKFFCRVFGIEDKFDGEIDFDIDLSCLTFEEVPYGENAVKDENELFDTVKEIIKTNLRKLGADEKRELINRVFALDKEFALDIPYTIREKNGTTTITFGGCPVYERPFVKYYHTYNYADDTKRVNALMRLIKDYPEAVFTASGRTAALINIAEKYSRNITKELTDIDEKEIHIPGYELIK